MKPRRPRRLGPRREVLILPPVALLLLVVVSLFTLASYRGALEALMDQRRQEARQLAAAAVRVLDPATPVSSAQLRGLVPQASSVAFLDAQGWPLVVVGDVPMGNLLTVEEGSAAAVVPLPVASGSATPERYLRVEVDPGVLESRLDSLPVLTVMVIGVNVAVVLLILLFLRHVLAPYETLLQGVRRIQPTVDGDEAAGDDVEGLLATFERAMAELGRSRERSVEDDIAVLERTLTANLESGLLLLDREGRILALNPVGANLLKMEPPAAGTPLDEALAAHPGLLELLRGAVEQGRAIPRREARLERGGEWRTVGLTAHLLRRDDGGVRGFLVLFADLTEIQRQADQERLEESLAQLGELAGGVAHELRNSLATLRGYLTLIDREPEEETIADYLGEIRRETDHLQRVVEDFLAFARPGSVRPQTLDLETVVRRAAADPMLAATTIELTVAPDLPSLMGDPQLLERAVRNLLHNAAKAQAEIAVEGPVEVSLQCGGTGVRLVVADRGPGVSPDLEERLFQPFATGFREGVGLGLALTYRIIALHRGRLELKPRPGGGTRAEVELGDDTSVTKGNKPSGAASESVPQAAT